MDIDHLSEKERCELMAEMADLYYNEGKTQSEIAKYFGTNRFRVAKLLQDARNEQIVEIKINRTNERGTAYEGELIKYLSLNKAIVVNTQYSPYIDGQMQLGKVGALYLGRLLKADTVLGITWGKTIYSIISQLPQTVYSPITCLQVTGYVKMMNPAVDTRELVRTAAVAYGGSYYYLDTPLYVRDPALLKKLREEPAIKETLAWSKRMDILLTGIGSRSSLPTGNPRLRAYMDPTDLEQASEYIGSLYGYVLGGDGRWADIELNKKVMGAKQEDILRTPHRIVVACGKHKADVLIRAAQAGLYNELITDMDTAYHLLGQFR